MTTPQIDLKLLKGSDIPKEVLEVYTYLKLYLDQPARAKWIKRREIAWDAIENDILTDADKKEIKSMGQTELQINKCNKGVQGSCAIVTDQKPELKFYPVGSSDLYVAELLKRAHDYVWAKNGANDITYDACEEAKIGGIGILGAKHNPSKGVFGAIEIYEEPPDDIYWDADARKRDLSDSHLIKAKLRTKSYIKEIYDDITDEDLTFESGAKDDSSKSTGVTKGDNYAEGDRDQTPDTQGSAYQQSENIWEIDAWMLKREREHWMVEIGEDGNINTKKLTSPEEIKAAKELPEGGAKKYWPRLIEKRYRRIIVGKKLIKETVNPFGTDAEGDPVLAFIPIPHQRTRTSYPMSPTNYAVDINREKIRRRIQFQAAASHSINSPIVEPPNLKWIGPPGTPGSRVVVPSTAPFQPTRMPSGGMDIGRFIELEQLADRDIDDQYDLHDVMRGKIPKGQDNMAGRTVLALQDMGGMMSKPFLRKLESALINLGKLDMVLILRNWPRSMWERLLEDEEKPPNESKEAMMEQDEDSQDDLALMVAQKYQQALDRIRPQDPAQPPGIDLMDLDVRITAGSSMPTNRMAKASLAIEKVQAGIYDAEAALEYEDDPLKDKVVQRLKQAQQMGAMQPKK